MGQADVRHRSVGVLDVVQSAAAAETAGSRDGHVDDSRGCALAVIILPEGDLTGIDELPVFDCHGSGIGRHHQCCRHDQRQHKGCHVFEYFQMASSSAKDKTSLFPERSSRIVFLNRRRGHR